MPLSVQIRALLKAAELTGGRKQLAARLGVKPEDVEKWAAGTAIPREFFLRIVTVILDEVAPSEGLSDPPDVPPSRSSAPASPRGFD